MTNKSVLAFDWMARVGKVSAFLVFNFHILKNFKLLSFKLFKFFTLRDFFQINFKLSGWFRCFSHYLLITK